MLRALRPSGACPAGAGLFGGTNTTADLFGDGVVTSATDSKVLFGSPTDQPGVRTADRVIPAGGTDTLYIKAYLDGPSTDNSWQATGTAISLVFNSFQTANNTP